MNYRIAWILSVSAVLISGSMAKLTVVPKNVAVVEGDVAIFNCTTNNDSRLIWRIVNGTSASFYTIYTGSKFYKNYADYCEIDNSTKGQFTLRVKTRKEISLHYVCEEPGEENAGADLVVLESNPRCELVDDRRDQNSSVGLQVWCSVHFVGNWIPVMEWKMISAEGHESTVDIGSIDTTSTNNVVNSIINLTARSSLNGSKYICTTRFTEFSRLSNYSKLFVGRNTWPVATNVPEYSFTWMSQTFHIVTEANVSLVKLTLNSSMSTSVAAIIIPIIMAMVVVGGVFLLIRYITKRQKINNLQAQNLTSNADDTPKAEYVELDAAPARIAKDDIHALSIYEHIYDESRVPDPYESISFSQEDYASLADRKFLQEPIYTSVRATPDH